MKFTDIFSFLQKEAPQIEEAPKVEEVPQEKKTDELLEMVKQLSQTNASMPRNYLYNQSMAQITTTTRDVLYIEQLEMYNDPFTREMVKIIISRGIGIEHDDTLPFQITLTDEAEINPNALEMTKKEFEYLEKLIIKELLAVSMDSQFFGDGYIAIQSKEKEGVIGLVNNLTTKPFNITPIVSNYGRTVAYEVSPNQVLMGAKQKLVNGRRYVLPSKIARINSPKNGVLSAMADSYLTIDKMDAFSDKETYYEDLIYGGVTEGCVHSFRKFKWAIESLANMRIASSVLERYITIALESLSENERTILKEALETNIKKVQSDIKSKIQTNDPTATIANYIIPTTTGGTGGISIQESTPNFNQQVEDIIMHIKRYMADIGFNIQLTPYGDSQIGGNENDGVPQNSIQMETQGKQVRQAVEEYIRHITSVHFQAKFGLDIDQSKILIDFNSVINVARIMSERQRMEAVGNTQQFGSIVDSYRASGYEDTPATRTYLYETFKPLIPNTAEDKETMLKSVIDHILTKPKVPVEQGEEL